MAAKKPPAPAALRTDLAHARAHWQRRQGLDGPRPGSLHDVVAATGWLRTLGGVDVYLALRARVPSLRRADLEAAVADGSLQVLPAVRNCIYLVPRQHAALVLRLTEEPHGRSAARELSKAGVSGKELSAVMDAALAALRRGPLTTDALRKALPPGVVRSLGEKGKKVGLASPLPPALRELEVQGKVMRLPVDHRLDTQQYTWAIPPANPRDGARVPAAAADRHAELARLFLSWAGTASLADFASWSALSRRDARAAVDGAGAVPIHVAGYGDAFILPEQIDALRQATPVDAPRLLPFEDNLVALHQGPAALVDPEHHHLPVPIWGSAKKTTLGGARHMSLRAVLVSASIGGLWEYDPARREVDVALLGKPSAKLRQGVAAAAKDTGRFLREEMGHGKSFSLDNDASLSERSAYVRKLA